MCFSIAFSYPVFEAKAVRDVQYSAGMNRVPREHSRSNDRDGFEPGH